MVVDDNEADQFIAEIAIKKYNPAITIIRAYDGLEALQLLDNPEQVPNIIFLDINMPRMNGHEFLAEYDKRKPSNTVIIGMLTSSYQEKDKQKALQYENVKSYLLKPLESEDIEKVVALLTP